MTAEPFVSLGLLVDDDTALAPDAYRSTAGIGACVRVGVSLRIQSDSPAALRRLALALLDAADQADTLTAASAA